VFEYAPRAIKLPRAPAQRRRCKWLNDQTLLQLDGRFSADAPMRWHRNMPCLRAGCTNWLPMIAHTRRIVSNTPATHSGRRWYGLRARGADVDFSLLPAVGEECAC